MSSIEELQVRLRRIQEKMKTLKGGQRRRAGHAARDISETIDRYQKANKVLADLSCFMLYCTVLSCVV